MRRLLSCVAVLAVLVASIESQYAEVADQQNANGQYGLVYALDFENNQKRSNSIDDDDNDGNDFKKLPENGLLIIRLLPKPLLKGTVLENTADYRAPADRRFKRSPGKGGGGCNTCGGGGGGHRPGGGGGGGGGGSAGAWSTSSSGAWGKGGGKGK
ncbi:hypothetical protein Trydic_g14481 [Trypoxylus dichotomus]